MRGHTCDTLLHGEGGMLHIAAEAFRAKNFDLAAEIYECQLAGVGDPGARLELLVQRADALAYGGKLPEALAVYRRASETERLQPRHLDNLIHYLSAGVRTHRAAGLRSGFRDFSCGKCLSFLREPVTLPCGHSFCKRCLHRDRDRGQPVLCTDCGDSCEGVRSFRVNVVLSHLLAKWFPSGHRTSRLKGEEAALERDNQATLTGTGSGSVTLSLVLMQFELVLVCYNML